jgi:hypothetical protein
MLFSLSTSLSNRGMMATTTKLKNATRTSRNTFSDIEKTLAAHKAQHYSIYL